MTESEALCARLGITYRQLDYWTRQGWLRPVQPRAGSGFVRSWPESELQVAAEMGRLVRLGLVPAVAARAARALVDNGWREHATG